jgi:regulation of enolase protein 1 (concanavalin A-like superfamily)
MWYAGVDTNGVTRIGYAMSPDGVAWTKYGSNPVLSVGDSGSWEDEDVTEPTVLKVGSTYHMWYRGTDGMTSRIGHATSSDGITWSKDTANPVLDVGSPGVWDWLHTYGPSVIRYNDVFLMWYSGETLPRASQTGYALSSDGSAWTRGGMLIPEGTSSAFDADSADYPSVMAEGDGFKVWYSGLNNSGDYTIGYATAEICSSTPLSNRIYLPIVLKGSGPCPAYYTDNFSNANSGWPADDNSNRRYAYTDGQYQIWVKQYSQGWFATPGAKATDFTAVVSARRTSGTLGQYGILFGINEDWSQYYQFGIDGAYYSIWRYDGSWTALKDWTQSNYIATGTAWNRLKVIRNGSSIAVYANSQLLTTVTDSNLTGLRRIGLVAYSPDNASLDARFDDFSLYPASCGASAYAVSSDAGQFEIGQPEVRQLPSPPRLPQH